MKKHVISTPGAPSAIGTYSQAIRVGNLLFASGQIGLDPETMKLRDSFKGQVVQIFSNISEICLQAGGSLDSVVKLTVFLKSMEDFGELNVIMKDFFKKPFPARSAVGISELPMKAAVEVEAIIAL